MRTFLWAVTIVGGLLGTAVLFFGEIGANGAPQEAAVAAIAMALVVVPYCLARAATEIVAINRERKPTE